MEEIVQCEFCDTYVYLNEYLEHTEICSENENIQLNIQNSFAYSLTSSLTSSISSTIFNTLYINDNNITEINDTNDENENEYDLDDEEFIVETINLITGNRTATNFNIYDPYRNLQDVNNPVKDIDLVAPLIPYENIPDNDLYCTICQDKISKKVRKTLCNHYYCAECIEPWLKELNKKCPICSSNLEDLLSSLIIKQNEHTQDEEDNDFEEIKKDDIDKE
jgi:hypothetical protein